MNILVLNGSPKGEYSITLQTVRFLEKLNPEDKFTVLHVGQRIKALEKDFSSAVTALEEADVLLFSYPVYTFIAPCQLHRFIELMKEHKVAVSGKIATQITTSKHFYDVTAHRYIQDNCQDMGLNVVRGLSADMEDLTSTKGQNEAKAFWTHLHWCVENEYFEACYNKKYTVNHKPVTVPTPISTPENGDVVIVTDCEPDNTQLTNMIARFQAKLPVKSRIVNIAEYPLKGGCLGCFNCAPDGVCIYNDKFDVFLRDEIQTAQAIIYAFTIKDHSMGSRFKMYDDRQFCNGHRTVTMNMPIGYLISGNLSEEENLRTIVEARSQVGGNIPAGIATDEFDPDKEIDKLIRSLVYALENRYIQPSNFYGVGGMKIFRDLIYQMRGMMRADHKFFKSHGQYDFPQKKKGQTLLMYLVGAMLANKKIKAKMGNKMNEGMIAPYKKVIDNIETK